MLLTDLVFSLSYSFSAVASPLRIDEVEKCMAAKRLLSERAIEGETVAARRTPRRAARSVTVNLAESPLGWLLSRGHVSERQFDAGERLRADYERAALSPRVTMAWDAAPVASTRSGAAGHGAATVTQIDAKRRFHAAMEAVGPGLSDILWRVVCYGDGMRDAETALGWPVRAGKLVLTLALDRVAAYYRIQ